MMGRYVQNAPNSLRGGYFPGARVAGRGSRHLGFIDPATATMLVSTAASLFGKLFGGDPRKLADTQTVEEFNQNVLVPANQALVADRAAVGKAPNQDWAQGLAPEQIEGLAVALEQALEQMLARFQRTQSGSNLAVTLGKSTIDGLRKWAARKAAARATGGGAEIIPGTGITTGGILPWAIGAGLLYFGLRS